MEPSFQPTPGQIQQSQQPLPPGAAPLAPVVVQVVPPQPSSPPPASPNPSFNPLKVASSIIFRKDQVNKTGGSKKKTIHILSRMDLTKEVMSINAIIGGIHLVDSKNRPSNPHLCFQQIGTHFVLDLSSEVQKFAEEDIFLVVWDVFFNAGFVMTSHYDQVLQSAKGMGETIQRESFIFQRVRPMPVFMTQ